MKTQHKGIFNGDDYQPKRDDVRLTGQIKRIFGCMKDGQWRSLGQIAGITGDPEASVSAQLRHLRKKRFGGHKLEKVYKSKGLYHYKLTVNTEINKQMVLGHASLPLF